MAIIRLDCNLNGGDSVTPNNELFYRIYGDVDNYAAPIWTTGTALTDANVTVDNDRVIITGVDGLTNTLFKIAAVDGAGNEGILSDEFVQLLYEQRVGPNVEGYALQVWVDTTAGHDSINIATFDWGVRFTPKSVASTAYLLEAGDINVSATVGHFVIRYGIDGEIRVVITSDTTTDDGTVTRIVPGALTVGVEAFIEFKQGNLWIDGVNQNLDFSPGPDNVAIDAGSINNNVTIYASKADGTTGCYGEIRSLRYYGEEAVFAQDGVTFPGSARTGYWAFAEVMFPY